MKLKEKIAIAIGIIAILGFSWKAVTYIDERYANAQEVKKDVQKIEQKQEKDIQRIEQRQEKEAQRLDYKILSDQYESIQKRVYQIEDRYLKVTMPDTVKEEYRDLQNKKEDKKKKLDILEKEVK